MSRYTRDTHPHIPPEYTNQGHKLGESIPVYPGGVPDTANVHGPFTLTQKEIDTTAFAAFRIAYKRELAALKKSEIYTTFEDIFRLYDPAIVETYHLDHLIESYLYNFFHNTGIIDNEAANPFSSKNLNRFVDSLLDLCNISMEQLIQSRNEQTGTVDVDATTDPTHLR